MRRRAAALALAAVLPLLAHAALGPRYGGEVRLGVADLPARTEPEAPQGSGPAAYQALVHETLVDLDDEGLPVPALAASWSASRDGTVWTLTLRERALFHDGSAVTAADAVRSLQRFLRARSAAAESLAEDLAGGAAYRAGRSEALPGLQALDGRRLQLRFERAPARPLAVLSSPAAAVTSAGGAGAGPFVPTLAAGGRITVAAFGGHVRGRPFWDNVSLIAGDPLEGIDAKLRARDLDLAPVAAEGPRLTATLLLKLDARRPPFDQPAVRAALAGALLPEPLLGRFLAGADLTPRLLAPALLPAPLPVPAPAAGARLPAELLLAVDHELPPLVSQRVVAFLANAGTRVEVQALSAAAARADGAAPARLLLFRPEVAEPSLALRELMALAGEDGGKALDSAAHDPDPAR
ncbi:MAG TPA: ABC transporter substrate-binding protein, partial [Vicinamibacteria bacterium]